MPHGYKTIEASAHNFDLYYNYKKKGKASWNLLRRKRAVAEIKFHNQDSHADSLFIVVLERQKGLVKRVFGN